MSLRLFTRQIAANSSERIAVVGNLIYLRSASAQVLVTARQNRPDKIGRVLADASPLSTSQKIKTDPDLFDDVTFQNTTAAAVDMTAIIGVGDYDAPIISLSNPNALASAADVAIGAAATAVLPVDLTRLRAHVKALATNAVNVRIGDANVTATRGVQLQPGEGVTINGTAAIFGIEEGAGAPSDVTVTTEHST